MSSKDWDEVKRLAADFQRAQLTVAAQRLTERNCIEIVNKLIELKLLDVVFTTDGKEYITPQQLNKEILDELFMRGGRLSLGELATELNVSIASITNRIQELVKSDRSLHFVLGVVVTTLYLDTLAHDLNERLSQDGVLNLNDVSKTTDLPGEFLNDQMSRRVGKIIKGKHDDTDPSILYTEAFVRRNTARIRGILSAITRPTPVNHIITKVDQVSEKLFFQIVGKLLASKRVDGIVSSLTRSSYYIPTAYTKSQINYVENFMSGNGYIDLDAALHQGINDPRAFIKKRFPDQNLVFLKTCCIGESLFKQVQSQMEEGLGSPGWIDISGLLPFGATEKDIQLLLQVLVDQDKQLVCGTTVINMTLLNTLKQSFRPFMKPSAQEAVNSGVYVTHVTQLRALEQKTKLLELNALEADGRSNKKDDRRKKAMGGKGGGGTQGRETKTKSTKKKYMVKKDETDSEEEEPKSKSTSSKSESLMKMKAFEFMSLKKIGEQLKKEESLSESSGEIIQFIASQIHGPLTEDYQPILKEVYEEDLANKMSPINTDLGDVCDPNEFIPQSMRDYGYIDLKSTLRMGINDPKSFIHRRFPEQRVLFLKSFCLGDALVKKLKNTIEEGSGSSGWVDVARILPFEASEKDMELLFQSIVNPATHTIFGSTVVSVDFLNKLRSSFKPLMELNAKEVVDSGAYATHLAQLHTSEAKSPELKTSEGKGNKGKEAKSKSSKKKGNRRNDSESEDEVSKPSTKSTPSSTGKSKSMEFMNLRKINEQLKKDEGLASSSPELVQFMATKLYGPLAEEYQLTLKSIYEQKAST